MIIGNEERINAAAGVNFNQLYPAINAQLVSQGKTIKSRNGDTIELEDFQTVITNPTQRCVGGHKRNINIYFLLAEAIWIWLGKKDVKFLKTFNERMSDYSDDGLNFHAPYGFRLRSYGQSSFLDYGSNGLDQIKENVELLSKNPEDRRAVASIWNPLLDCNTTSKDIPCNDLLMFKIRDGKLNLTIQNRSNDLHWGLPTNVFQFSFISELMSLCLGVKVGKQVHNSQSLHVYLSNPITLTMLNSCSRSEIEEHDFYTKFRNKSFDFEFEKNEVFEDPISRLKFIDETLEGIYNNLSNAMNTEGYNILDKSVEDICKVTEKRSEYFAMVECLLLVYISQKNHPKTDEYRLKYDEYIKNIIECFNYPRVHSKIIDVLALSRSFFLSRVKSDLSTQEERYYAQL